MSSFVAFWHAADRPRRVLLATLAAAVVLVAGLLLGAPALHAAIARAEHDVARSRSMLQIARERIAESQGLAQAAAPARAGSVRAAVERVFARHALQANPADGGTAEGRFTAVVARGRFDAIVNALDALARDEGVRLVEGTLTALVDPGAVRAELTFQR